MKHSGGVWGSVRRGLKFAGGVAETVGVVKGIWDAGRAVVGAAAAVAPYLEAAAPALALI
jgi:hypothetical protein